MAAPNVYDYERASDVHVDRRADVNADHAVRLALLEQSMKGITSELHSINSNVSKLVWLVMSAIGTSVMHFIVTGGLLK